METGTQFQKTAAQERILPMGVARRVRIERRRRTNQIAEAVWMMMAAGALFLLLGAVLANADDAAAPQLPPPVQLTDRDYRIGESLVPLPPADELDLLVPQLGDVEIAPPLDGDDAAAIRPEEFIDLPPIEPAVSDFQAASIVPDDATAFREPGTRNIYEEAETNAPFVSDPIQNDSARTDRDLILASLTTEPAPVRPTLREEFFRQLREAMARDEDVIFGEPRLSNDADLPEGDWNVVFEFRLPQRGIGTVVGTGTIYVAGQPQRRVTASVSIDRRSHGLQVRRLIRRNEVIRPEDLIELDAQLSQLPADALAYAEPAVGSAARTEIRPGMWITGRMLERPTVVRNRQAVTMRLTNGPIELVAKGIARQDGAAGDAIRVENLSSGREIVARVVDRETVEVIY